LKNKKQNGYMQIAIWNFMIICLLLEFEWVGLLKGELDR
jgi:hypothetical protein